MISVLSLSPPASGWATTALTTTVTHETPEGEVALPGQQPGTHPWNPLAPRMTSVTRQQSVERQVTDEG